MFSFFKKKYVPQRGPVLMVDLHSHFIPAIDDGSQSMEESLTLLRGMADLGYKKVITTPHIMVDAYKNTPEIIKSGLLDVRQALVKEGIDIEIDAAAEYYLDDGFLPLLEKGDLMPVNDTYLLFETSYISKPLQLEEMIFEIGAAGYTPLMAHPERYRYIKNPAKEYTRLKDLGVKFQVNLNSFGGHYGKSAQVLVSFIKEQGMIDFLGSDAHHKKQIETLSEVFVSEAYNDIFDKNKILNHIL
jgi:tyrosine-protein phosphatase YwqE